MPEEVTKEGLKAALDRDYRDGTLADAVNKIAQQVEFNDPVAGSVLYEAAKRLSRPSALSVGEEDALAAWVTKIALEGDIAAKDGLEFGDLVRAFRAGFRAAIAAMNGGGE